MRALCLLIIALVCTGSVTAQWGWGYGRPYYGPIGPFGGTPYARLRAMQGYGMMPYGGYGGFGGFGGYPMYRGWGWG